MAVGLTVDESKYILRSESDALTAACRESLVQEAGRIRRQEAESFAAD